MKRLFLEIKIISILDTCLSAQVSGRANYLRGQSAGTYSASPASRVRKFIQLDSCISIKVCMQSGRKSYSKVTRFPGSSIEYCSCSLGNKSRI